MLEGYHLRMKSEFGSLIQKLLKVMMALIQYYSSMYMYMGFFRAYWLIIRVAILCA